MVRDGEHPSPKKTKKLRDEGWCNTLPPPPPPPGGGGEGVGRVKGFKGHSEATLKLVHQK